MQTSGLGWDQKLREFVRGHPRWVGAGFLSLGAAFDYWFLLRPIRQAEAGAQEIAIDMHGVTLGICLPLFGLALVALGPKLVRDPSAELGRSRTASIVVGLILAAIGIAVYFWLKHYLESHGYGFS
ncbi:MAG: hypothetical protein HY508_08625 [Acidobacteria bacterium]|nr:hypothetical protein [Acidobacteriota bacterium]